MTRKTDQLPTLDDSDLATTCGGIFGILGFTTAHNAWSTECHKAREGAWALHSKKATKADRDGAVYDRQNCLAMRAAHGAHWWQ